MSPPTSEGGLILEGKEVQIQCVRSGTVLRKEYEPINWTTQKQERWNPTRNKALKLTETADMWGPFLNFNVILLHSTILVFPCLLKSLQWCHTHNKIKFFKTESATKYLSVVVLIHIKMI